MTQPRRLARLAALVLMVLALGAGAALAQTKSTWETIKERGSIRIGAAQAEPWSFSDPITKEWSGIGPSYGRALAAALGVKVEFVEVTWGTAVAALQSNKIDVMPLLSVTPERALAIEFTNQPLSFSVLSVLVPQSMQVATWDDLDKPEVTMGVNQGSSEDYFVTKRLTHAKILRFATYADILAAYQAGNVTAAAMYHPTMILLIGKADGAKIAVPKPARLSFSDAAVRREPDKTLRDWLAVANHYFYEQGMTEEWYETFLASRGIDPKKSPPIQKERW